MNLVNTKRIVLIFLMLALALSAFSSCKNNTDEPNKSEDSVGFLSGGASVFFVIAENSDIRSEALENAVFDITGNYPVYRYDSADVNKREIILGETSRELSKKAYRELERLELEGDNQGYVIYSSGASVAIAFSGDTAFDVAIDEFIATCLDEEKAAELKQGLIAKQSFSVYEYYDEISRKERAEQWETLEAVVNKNGNDGSALVGALKELYSIYSSDVYRWLANLYDPVTGGFYFSNSGRNTEGYLPDLESTRQALGFISESGLEMPGGYSEDIKNQIVRFVQSTQSEEDGYFYHIQWKTVTDSRLGRDLNSAISILSRFGAKPLYPTAADRVSGDGTAMSLSTGRYAACSMLLKSNAIAVSSSRYSSKENFLEYLNSFDWSVGNSYENGNTIAAQSTMIKASGLLPTCIEFFNSIQNPKTGMWSDVLNNEAVNGFMKISFLYTSAGTAIPHAKLAVEGILKNNLMMYSGAPEQDRSLYASTPCHVYNPWTAIDQVLTNLNGAGEQELRDEIISMVREQAPEQIEKSKELILAFRKEDGSFSWQYDTNSPSSQGAPVAVVGINEGDVNSTSLSSISLIYNIYGAMGLGKYQVDLFGKGDAARFNDLLSGMGEIIKTGVESVGVTDFDGGSVEKAILESWRVELDTFPEDLEHKNYAYSYINDEKQLVFGKRESGSAGYLGFRTAGSKENTRFVLSLDFKYDGKSFGEESTGQKVKISMYNDGGRFYYATLNKNTRGKLCFETNPNIELDADKWYNLRFEYYKNTLLNVCMVYVNNKYVGDMGNSDATYSDEGWSKGLIELMSGASSIKLTIDNISMTRDDELHETEKIENWHPENYPTLPEGDASPGNGKYFNDLSYVGIRHDYNSDEKAPVQDSGNNSVLVELTESDYVLWYKLNNKRESYLTYGFENSMKSEENCVGIVEFDYKTGNVKSASPTRFGIWCGGIEAEIRILNVNGSLRFGNKVGEHFSGSPRLSEDTWYNFRFEFYCSESSLSGAVVKVYINNEYAIDLAVTDVNNRADKSDRINIYLHKDEENAYMCLDNIYLGYEEKEYVKGEAPAELPEPPTPEFSGDVSNGFYESDESGYRKDGTEAPPAIQLWPADRAPSAEIINREGSYLYKKLDGNSDEYITFNYPMVTYMPKGVSVLEMDITLDKATSRLPASFAIYADETEARIYIGYNEDEQYYYLSTYTGKEYEGSPHFEPGVKYKLRLEYYYYCDDDGGAEFKVYVNNTHVTDLIVTNLTARAGRTNRFNFYLGKSETAVEILFDNLFMGYMNKTYEAMVIPEADENNGKGQFFTGALEGVSYIKYDYNDGMGTPKIDGLNSSATAEVEKYMLRLKKVSSGNSYVHYSFNALGQTVLKNAASVFEADMMFGGLEEGVNQLGSIHLANSKKEAEIRLWVNSEGKVYFGNCVGEPAEGTPYLDADKWYNIRIVSPYYRYTAGVATNSGVEIYVNGELACVLSGVNVVDRSSKSWDNRAFIYLYAEQTKSYMHLDNLYIGYTDIEDAAVPPSDDSELYPSVEVKDEDLYGNGENTDQDSWNKA